MSERQSSEFDDHAGQPDPTSSQSSDPFPLRPRSEEDPQHEAPRGSYTGLGQAFPPPPLATGQPSGDADDQQATPPSNEMMQPERPGAHRVPFDGETTSIVDRDWLAAQVERTEQLGQFQRHRPETDRDSSQFGELPPPPPPPPPHYGGPGRPPGATHPADPRSTGHTWQPGQAPAQWKAGPPPAAWQHQQPPTMGGEGAGPAAARPEWTAAQGSSSSWNYVDNIRSSELVPTRRIPPGRGWRKFFYYSTFKLINPGQSPDERYEAELQAKVRSLVRGTYKIAVVGKGGVGKSTVSAGVGSIFAELRQDDRVVAIDADTAFGKLAARIDPGASQSYWEVAGDPNLNTFADMRSRVGSNAAGLFVLGGPPETARRRVLTPEVYSAATRQLDRHFPLSIIDCGSTMDAPVTRAVLNDVDALIVVSSPWFDGASAAGQTLEWLANGGFTSLLHRTVVVVNDSDGHAEKKDLKLLMERFGKHGQKVIDLPYDQHLRPGGVIDVKNEISPLTRRRLLELAAGCAEHFAATTDRPRGGADDRHRR